MSTTTAAPGAWRYHANVHDPSLALRLRDTPGIERFVRVALALLATAYLAFTGYQELRRPELVTRASIYERLLSDVQEGLVERIDDSGERHVLWRHHDGTVYAERAFPDVLDLRASVAAQPRVRAGDAVEYGPIAAPPVEDGRRGPSWSMLGMLVLLFVLRASPPPRLLTRWGWGWLIVVGAGIPFYVAFSGSWRWAGAAPARRRDGRLTFAVAVTVGFALSGAVHTYREVRYPDRPLVSHAEPVRAA